VFDHLWPLGQPWRPALECWTLLAALAARAAHLRAATAAAAPGEAARFRLGTLVTRAGLRPPALLAHMAATVGEVAGAPPIVGIGTGDAANRQENQAFGLPYHADPALRAASLVRAVAALRGPLAGRPGPAVWVGGSSRRARGLAGRLGDAWNGWGLGPDELAAGLAEARRAAEGAGRDPAAVAGTWAGQVLVGEDAGQARALLERWGAERPPGEVASVVAGDADAVARRLAELGEAGARWCVLAMVGGSGAAMRSLLAETCGLPGNGNQDICQQAHTNASF